jgi:hypothetical protein
MPGRSPVLGSIRASWGDVVITGDLAGAPTAVIGIPVAEISPETGTKCLAACSASCFACSKISFIFCSVSADSSSDSLAFPPVALLMRGDLGDFAAVGLAMAVLIVGDNFSSVDSRKDVIGDGTVGSWIGSSGSCF